MRDLAERLSGEARALEQKVAGEVGALAQKVEVDTKHALDTIDSKLRELGAQATAMEQRLERTLADELAPLAATAAELQKESEGAKTATALAKMDREQLGEDVKQLANALNEYTEEDSAAAEQAAAMVQGVDVRLAAAEQELAALVVECTLLGCADAAKRQTGGAGTSGT